MNDVEKQKGENGDSPEETPPDIKIPIEILEEYHRRSVPTVVERK